MPGFDQQGDCHLGAHWPQKLTDSVRMTSNTGKLSESCLEELLETRNYKINGLEEFFILKKSLKVLKIKD